MTDFERRGDDQLGTKSLYKSDLTKVDDDHCASLIIRPKKMKKMRKKKTTII